MNEHDVDVLLREAGRRLRLDAPAAAETEDALARTQDRPARPSRWRWAGPALLVGAAAAATIAVLAVTQDEDTLRQVPAESTVPPTAAPTTAAPSTTAAPVVVPPTGSVVESVEPGATAPTTSTAPSTTIPATGWVVTVVEENYDGAGGDCMAVARAGAESGATGCVDGERVASRVPVFARVDDTWLIVAVEGDSWVARDVAELSNDVIAPCLELVASAERLVDLAGCTGEAAIYGLLPPTPSGETDWRASRWGALGGESVATLADVDPPPGVRAFEIIGTVRGSAEPRCVAVVAAGSLGWRESCAPIGDDAPFLAGLGSEPVYVEVDAERRVTGITALDPDLVPVAHGCRASLGQLLASVPTGATTALRCVDGAAITGYSGTTVHTDGPEGGITLHRDAGDGTWPIGDLGPTLTCARYAETCAAFGATESLEEALLPIPRLDVLTDPVPAELGPDLLDPMETTARYSGLAPAPDQPALAEAVEAAWRAEGDTETQLEVLPGDSSPLRLMGTAIPDDSIGGVLLVVWYSEAGDGLVVDAVVEIISCSRGTTTLDGAKVCV